MPDRQYCSRANSCTSSRANRIFPARTAAAGALLLAAAALSGCANLQQDSYRYMREERTSLSVISGREFGYRFVTVKKNAGAWYGSLTGGSEKYEARRTRLRALAEEEIVRICGAGGFQLNGEPEFEMIDDTANSFTSPQNRSNAVAAAGGGLVAFLVVEMLAAAHSPAENLPAAMRQTFKCKDEIGKSGELPKRW